MQIFRHFLPFCYGIVIYILRNFSYYERTKLILYIRQEPRSIKCLECRIRLVERLFGVNIIRKMHIDTDGQFALRSITVRSDSPLRNIVAYDLSF